MKAPNFLYRRPDSLDQALALLDDNAGDAQILAGGQSLMPMMAFRVAQPSLLVDLRKLPDLNKIAIGDDGVRLRLRGDDGRQREVVDAMSSWWSVIHGYRHPVLDAAVTDQIGRMSHVMFGGLTHEPAIRLCSKLVEITPEPLQHVFLCDSGSVSVEVAIKMALQYWVSKGRPEKRRLATWRGGYHGDTFHPMSVCDPEGGMHSLWTGVLPAQVFAGVSPVNFDEGWWANDRAQTLVRQIGTLALVLTLLFLLLALVQGLFAGDVGGMLRATLVEVPVTIGATVALMAVTQLLLGSALQGVALVLFAGGFTAIRKTE